VVVAVPTYEGGVHVRAAIGSLLAQSEPDLRVVAVDDGSQDGTADVLQELAAADRRLDVHVNPRRLGMLRNTNRALALARERWPGADFVALGSDHDIWEPGWLVALSAALDASPTAVLAYPLTTRIDASGKPAYGGPRQWRCDTSGIENPWLRCWRVYRCMVAGDMIYGLLRTRALDAVGGEYKPVLVPDRLLLAELALHGEFVQVEAVLWRRRFTGLADIQRQRKAFWPEGHAPGYTRLPWWVVHSVRVAWELAVVGRGDGRLRGAAFALLLLVAGLRLRLVRRLQRLRRRVGSRLEAPTRVALRRSSRFRGAVRARRLPVPADTSEVLERLLESVEGAGSPDDPREPARPTGPPRQ
jgi:glycosyltransferase involved in cell wall biosynthesis